ncbi:sigma factor-like helix-turn-helix DNA-binding protein [Xanthomonas sp. NCPPB 2654]|uniref:TnsA endonuclease N-terminal domain-containing protein n=1 Tax=unclassified Xanthomonas TaxID=2643310 RepID=UPI0021E09C2A|nr:MULTISPECIES: TnsA endonuclease N-terminal domain-containing protein [unclassified Xanthomonas]MDL5366803.1 sigma factor-like helix-turn-helix DNA-binding protein [Xanthomonas sp. NCPPB 2654]UYC20076.1 TnsA endonuclease N-terminal domain-containing protein [Xanthomonas sp. CFBP 8443]
MTKSKNSPADEGRLPKRHGKPWSSEELSKLIEGVKSGLNLDQLASSHHRSRSGISGAATRLLPEQMRPATRTHSVTVLAQYLLNQQEHDHILPINGTPADSPSQGHIELICQEPSSNQATIPDEVTTDSEPSVDHSDVPMLVAVAVTSLSSKRDRDVLEMRLGLDGQRMTLAQIGKRWSVSRERVRQIQERALKRLAARARRGGTAGASLRRLMIDSPIHSSTSASWLTEVARSGFDVPLALALKFILRAAGFPKPQVESTITLLCEMEQSRRTELRTLASGRETADRVARKVSQWLSQCDWPDQRSAPPPREHLTAQRDVGDSDIAGSYHSVKLGRSVQYESGLELAVISLLEKSEHVAYYQEQPAVIRYAFRKKHYIYYPDLLIATTDGRCLLAEVKPTAHMALSINRAKADAARAWAHAQGWGWLVLNENHTFRQIAQHELSAEQRAVLDNELRKHGFITWKDTPALRARHGLTALDLTAYIIQSGADLDLSYRITAPGTRVLKAGNYS